MIEILLYMNSSFKRSNMFPCVIVYSTQVNLTRLGLDLGIRLGLVLGFSSTKRNSTVSD